MKLKTLALAVAALALLAGIVFWQSRPPASAPADARVGQPLIDPAVIAQAAQLRLTDQGKSVTLVRRPDGSWSDPDYFGLAVDFSKLAGFVNDLTAAKIQRFVTANPDRIGRLEFKDSRIEFRDAGGRALWSLDLGRTADAGGRFVRFTGEDRAYLANYSTTMDSDPKSWADAQLINLKPDDIARVSATFDQGPPLTVSRPAKDAPWTAAPAAAGQKASADKIGSLIASVGALRFTDTTAPADPAAVAARQHRRTFVFTAFDGAVTTVALGRRPEAKKPALPAGPVYAFVTRSDPGAPINALMARRAFQVDDYVFTALPQTPADLLEAK